MIEQNKISQNCGQSMIEYVLLLTIIIIVLLAFIAPGGKFQQLLGNSLEYSVNRIERGATDIILNLDPP